MALGGDLSLAVLQSVERPPRGNFLGLWLGGLTSIARMMEQKTSLKAVLNSSENKWQAINNCCIRSVSAVD